MNNIKIKELEHELDTLDKKIQNGEVLHEEFDAVINRRKEIITQLFELGIIVKDDMVLTLAPKDD